MQQLIALEGTVECRTSAAAVGLSLQGALAQAAKPVARPAASAAAPAIAPAATRVWRPPVVQVLFSGVARITPQLPVSLHAVRVAEIEAAAASSPHAGAAPPLRCFCIDASEGHFEVLARGLQLHQDAHEAFFSAVPAREAPLALRWGWSLLLWLLRLGPFRWLLSRQ